MIITVTQNLGINKKNNMDKIIEALVKTIFFALAFTWWGISKDISTGLAGVAAAIVLFFLTDLLKSGKPTGLTQTILYVNNGNNSIY